MQALAIPLPERLQSKLGLRERTEETFPSAAGDIPRGALTEIAGAVSSGRTSLLHTLLAEMTAKQEFCALLDAGDTFDPESAAAAGVRLSQILWVRCGGNIEHALKAADMLAQGGGFGMVAVDLGDTPEKIVRSVPMAVWFRLRHGVENTRTALIVLEQQLHARSCSALKIEMRRTHTAWRGVLNGYEVTAQCTRNYREEQRTFKIAR